ncbi:hypothetical protein OsI_02311 [Oryza sativa Indica Group]|jgi:hypothetical protein|uniref:Uncharacterized protein n=3 Tax=Oryza TaxID=4527 RepID=A0A0E0MXM5_ORYRU|nr:hypothetical protein OsI_02311 [Oryza sativa Indica Group]
MAATEESGAVPDLDREAEDRQLVEAYDARADGVARSGWEGRSGGASGRRMGMGTGTGDAAAEAPATGRGGKGGGGG